MSKTHNIKSLGEVEQNPFAYLKEQAEIQPEEMNKNELFREIKNRINLLKKNQYVDSNFSNELEELFDQFSIKMENN